MLGQVASKISAPYAATLISGASEIKELAIRAGPLLAERPSTCHPEFYLASVSEKYWAPRTVQVTCDQRVVGIVYAKERLLAGRPTGIIYADGILGMHLIAEPAHREKVLSEAISCLLGPGRARALRLLIRQDGFEHKTISRIASSMEVEMASIQIQKHSRLALPSSYEDFLNSLGARTRRNFRYYRRRFEARGHHFVGRVPFESFCAAAWQLRKKSAIDADASAIRRSLNMLSAVSERVLVGLQAPDGKWLSIAGGWCENSTATLLFQMNNDREYQGDSISQVLRSYLVEELIASGIHDLIFWSGTSAPLARYTRGIPAVAVYLDSPAASWRLFRMLVASVAFRLPRRLMKFGMWITPLREYSNFD